MPRSAATGTSTTKNNSRRPLAPGPAARRIAAAYRERRDPPLRLYWLVGEAASRLDSGYGTTAIKLFTEQVRPLFPGQPLNESTVYRARQLYRLVTPRQLTVLVAQGVTWSQLTPLLALSEHPRVQQHLLGRLAAGEPLTSRHVRREVRTILRSDHARAGRAAAPGWRVLEAELRQVRSTLARLDHAAISGKHPSISTTARLVDQLEYLRDQLRRVHGRLRRAGRRRK
ncbi:MAG: hypothetical protein WD009_04990 [Phycisphaeraceae bacterium]